MNVKSSAQDCDFREEDKEVQDTVTPICCARPNLQLNIDCSPLDWQQYFDELLWLGPIPIYKAGTSGPVLLALHGAGSCSLSYACTAKLLKSHCRFLAFDFRAHGLNQLSEGQYQLDVDTLINETLSVMDYIRNITDNHQIILIGHSIGAAIASKAALEDHRRGKGVMGLILIDTLEGSAIDALPHMDNMINQRPKTFQTLEQAIQWAVNSNTVKNLESARISIPGQIIKENEIWRWRTDLAMVRQYYEGWFRGMNNAFLEVIGPKQLITAGSGKIDPQMMIAHMQGKFKISALIGIGFIIHEDAPEQFAEQVRVFISTCTLKHISTLYKRRLPSHLVEFASQRGKQIFKEALEEGNMESYFELSQQFLTQDRPEDCGLSTLVMALNTLGIDPGKTWYYPWRWFSEDLLYCGKRDPDGIELSNFVQLALCNKTWAMGFYPTIQKEKEMKINIKSSCNLCTENIQFRFASLDTFRSAIVSASRRSGFIIAVNSSRKALEQTGEGHYSPIGGYHSDTDMCLLLDVARFKYPAYWLPVSLMYEALEKKDPVSGNTRGFILLSRSKKHFPETCTASMDITSLEHLPRPVTEDLLLTPTQDFLALILHYFFNFYEDLEQGVIDRLENQLKEVEEPTLNLQLLNLVREMNPCFGQSTKLVSLGFSQKEFEEPLNGFVKKLKRDLGLPIS